VKSEDDTPSRGSHILLLLLLLLLLPQLLLELLLLLLLAITGPSTPQLESHWWRASMKDELPCGRMGDDEPPSGEKPSSRRGAR
jgi:hypothetical protein